MKKIMCIAIILLLNIIGSAQEQKTEGSNFKFKLGILYINSPTGERYRDGIKEAITDYSRRPETKTIFEVYDYHYDNERAGVEELVSLTKIKEDGQREVDLIFGPTDSGVFVRALEQRKELRKSMIPVISSQVAAKVPHQKGGWFFRTNINVERRSQVIYDYLNKYWIRSIAVLYENNEFGLRAEEAFRNELQEHQVDSYLPLSFDSADKARSQVRQVLAQRPEAVGIFGDRNNFIHLYKSLKKLNAESKQYSPLTFSIIDNRVIQNRLREEDELYFVSVTDTFKGSDFDDVKALSYDTTILVLEELNNLAKSEGFNYNDTTWRTAFRDRFEAILNGNSQFKQGFGENGSKTGLSFKNYENNTPPKVFRLRKNEIKAYGLEFTVSLLQKINRKLTLIWDRFGFWPIFNIFIIIIIVTGISVRDIRRWYSDKALLLLLKNPPFWLLVATNISIAMGVFIYLGETGNIRYDSVLTALILSLTPSTLLHITLFETSTGKAIGLAKYYESFLQWIYDKLTFKNYESQQRYINVIAYHNSEYGMKALLTEIYQNAPNKEQRIRLKTRMEETVKNAESWITRRKALARLLYQKLEWDKLTKLNFVPTKLAGCKPNSDKPLKEDPENVVLNAARLCAQDPLKQILIEEKIFAGLKPLRPERRRELEQDHEKDLSAMRTPTAIMRKKITFLFLLQGYDPDFCNTICCTPDTLTILDEAVEYCSAKEERKKAVNEKITKLKMELPANKIGNQKKEYQRILDQELPDVTGDPTCLKKRIGFLFAYNGCDINYLIANDLLPMVSK